MASLGIRIDDDLAARLPGFSVAAIHFSGTRLGMPTRKIEPMRDRVIAAARERIAAVRDPRRLPAIAAFHQAFPEVARKRLWLDDALRAIARHDPFPIFNDIVDSARLLSIHYAIPIAAIDMARVRPPVVLAIAPPGTSARTPQGAAADIAGIPALFDAGGALASPVLELGRAAPGRQTRDCAFVAFIPNSESAIDLDDFQARAANWLSTLTGARAVRFESTAGT